MLEKKWICDLCHDKIPTNGGFRLKWAGMAIDLCLLTCSEASEVSVCAHCVSSIHKAFQKTLDR